jgi:hypothetical protein
MLNQQDINFLTEYHFFTSTHLSTVARTVACQAHKTRKALTNAQDKDENEKRGDELGHLISHLYLLNYMQIEAFCALLYALAHPEGGVLSAHLSFAANREPFSKFIDKLGNGTVSIKDIGIQIADEAFGTKEHAGAEAQFKSYLKRFSNILQLQGNNLRDTYNKLKHGCIVVRHPDTFYSETPIKNLDTHSVYIPVNKKREIRTSRIPLSADENKQPPEDQYLLNIDFIEKMSKAFTEAVLNSI